MRIQNYGEWEGDKPGGHHPPNCTCYACNERRRAREAAEEETRRAAEYDRRMARAKARGQGRTTPATTSPRGGSLRTLLLCLFFMSAIVGVVLAAVIIIDPGRLTTASPPSPVVAPPPTEEASTETPEPTPGPTLTPTLVPGTPQPALTLGPAAIPTLAELRRVVLQAINGQRSRVGVSPVTLGTNGAAQAHAEASRDGCFTGHWGLDGTSPGMRYALAGGSQVNAENATGLNHCVRASERLQEVTDLAAAIADAQESLAGSPSHHRTMVSPYYEKVNIGIAWDQHTVWLVQQFEGGYVQFEQLPTLKGTVLSFSGQTTGGASLQYDRNGLKVDIYYHPLEPLTRGQVADVYCADGGELLGTLIAPAPPGYSYGSLDPAHTPYGRCRSPHSVPADTPAPSSYHEAKRKYDVVSSLPVSPASSLVEFVVSRRWRVDATKFDVTANVRDLLNMKGPGVYRLLFWGTVGGRVQVIADYPIFHEVNAPGGYARP